MLTGTRILGQENFLLRKEKVLPTNQQWIDVVTQYKFIPADKLSNIEMELDSTISANDCYKYIYNKDTSKFIAFFIMRIDKPKLDRLTHFGRTVHRHYQPSDKDSVLYISYILWGMRYEQNWYYDKDREYEFWDITDSLAKVDYLFTILEEIEYFKYKNPEKFWKDGGRTDRFKRLPAGNSYLKEYIGLPELVGWHTVFQIRRKNDLLNEKIEKTACRIDEDLWNSLHLSDSSTFHRRYIGKYSGKSCLIFYNPERNKILIPILYFDNQSQPWLTYYYSTISSTDNTLYQWLKFPTKKINRKPGDESLEIVYDIRKFLVNWNWGTSEMINSEKFWKDNFLDEDLAPIKK